MRKPLSTEQGQELERLELRRREWQRTLHAHAVVYMLEPTLPMRGELTKGR